MEIIFALRYHPKVVAEDIPSLSRSWKLRIKKAIEDKLTYSPEKFGKPLRQSLRGYRNLRIGDYRVVFRIDGTSVFILAILHRSVAYKDTFTRSQRGD